MRKIYFLLVLFFLFNSITKAQTNFYFVGTGINSDGASYNATTLGYEKTSIGTYFKSTTGGTVSDYTSMTCDGYTPGKTTSSSLFIFVSTADMTSMTVRGTGTGSNRTFTAMATSSTLGGTYSNVATSSGSGTIASSSVCGSIVITFGTTITAGTYMRFTFSGNLNVTSLVLASTPTITTSVSTLGGFTQTGATPSASQNYTVSGSGLSAATVDVAAPASFQVSTDNSTWVSNFSLPVSGGIITGQPKTIYTRLNDPAAGAHSGNITHMSTGATTVNVAVSGSTVTSPTITVSPASLAFGNVFVTSTSPEQSYTVSGVLLTPASGNITITAPANYQVSTTTGTGFSSSPITIPYSGGSLLSTTIYVRLQSAAVVAYNGNITNAGGGAPTANVAVTGAGVQQQIGDYGSVHVNGGGNWTAIASWKKWDGSGFNNSAAVEPTSADNVWINAGDTIIVNTSARLCNNLIVNGTVYSNAAVTSPSYIRVTGTSLIVNSGGFIGNSLIPTGDGSDGIGLASYSPNLTIGGTGGSIFFARVQYNIASSIITVDHDMTVNYHGSTNQGGHTVGLYPNGNFDCILNINAGKTLTFAPWSCLATTTSSNGFPALSMTVNVNGTLTMQNSPAPNGGTPSTSSYIYGGVGAGKVFTLNVGSTGVVNTYQFYPNGISSGSAGIGNGPDALVTVASGGQFNVSGLADFRKSTQTITGAGAFSILSGGKLKIGSPAGITTSGATGNIQTTTRNYNGGAIYQYDSTATAQVTGNGLPASVAGLTINNNTSNVTLTNSVTAVDSLKLTLGKLILGTKNVTTGSVKGGSSASYVVTDGTGYLKVNNVGAAATLFPVGPSATGYNPISLTNAGTADNFSVKVKPSFTNAPFDPNKVVNMEWAVNEDVAGGSSATIAATWNAATPGTGDEAAGFNSAGSVVVGHYGAAWDETTAIVSGTNPYTATATGFTSFSPFGVGNLNSFSSIVPLNLLSFNGSLQSGQVKLFWVTTSEINVRSYEVQKSIDARTYNSIGTVAALNGTANNNYNFTDPSIPNGVVYYRLKMIDRDGSFKYSSIIAINNKKQDILSVFPNPVKDNLFVSHAKAAAGAKLEVYAMDGRKMAEYKVVKDAVQTNVGTDVLPTGNYNLVFVNGSDVQFTKFLKR